MSVTYMCFFPIFSVLHSSLNIFLPHFSIGVHMLLLYVTSKNITFMLFCGKTHSVTIVSVGVCSPKEPEWMRGLFNHSFEQCFMETQQNSTCTCLLLFLLTWLCKYILSSASCVYMAAEPSQYFVMYLLSSFFWLWIICMLLLLCLLFLSGCSAIGASASS